MRHTNLITATFLALSLAMASCASEEPLIDPTKDVLRSYEFTMFDSQNDLSFSLADISTPVARVESPFNWLNISQGDNDEFGFTRIHIARTKPTPEGFDSDDAYLYLADNKVVKVTITAEGVLMPSDDNSYDEFNKEWWKQTSIKYTDKDYPQGVDIELPWSQARTTQIPAALIDGVNPGDRVHPNEGWSMAYNLFSANPSKPYFMLYNKYSGVMRVFYYQIKDVNSGGEFSFAVTPGQTNTHKFPFYHSLQYGIPVCNEGIQNKNVLNILSNGESPFQQLITPYVKDDVVLHSGWYCFDIDMSAYNPKQDSPFAKADVLSINCKTSSSQQVTLAGTFDGNSNGTIKGTSTSSGKGKTVMDDLKGGVTPVKNMVDAIKKGETLKAIFNGGMTVYNIYKLVTTDYDKETPAPEPPTIEQSFSGKISLSGYTYSATSNNAIGVEFYYNSFNQIKSLTGQGVWSLQENPVVYVVNDLLLGQDDYFAATVSNDGYHMGAQDPEKDNFRLFTYFDPSSIKINLNTSLFKDIRNVKVSWVYGVYPNQQARRTDVYRSELLALHIDEPIFIDRKDNVGKAYNSLFSDYANMEYLGFPLEEEKIYLTKVDTGTKAAIYHQKGGKYRYYGHPANNLSTTDDNFFVVDPIVFLPCELIKENEGDQYGKGMVYDFQAPDFVVGVMLTFDFTDDNGNTSHTCYSKRFLPEVRSITTDELLTKRWPDLKTYAKTTNHQSLNGGISVSHGNIEALMNRILKTIEYINTNKDDE